MLAVYGTFVDDVCVQPTDADHAKMYIRFSMLSYVSTCSHRRGPRAPAVTPSDSYVSSVSSRYCDGSVLVWREAIIDL